MISSLHSAMILQLQWEAVINIFKSTDAEAKLPDSNPSSSIARSIKLTVSKFPYLKTQDWVNIYKVLITMPGI